MTTKEQYWKNRERCRAYNRKWYQKNKERVKEKQRNWYQNNKDKAALWKKKWRWKYKCRDWAEKRRKELLKLKGNRCAICGAKNNLEFHHKEYKLNAEDIEVLCKKCHNELHVNMR